MILRILIIFFVFTSVFCIMISMFGLFGDRDTKTEETSMTPEEWKEQQKEEEALHANSLRVPRRFLSTLLPLKRILEFCSFICNKNLISVA